MSRINLSQVNISIAEFQKLSSGTYNAGEVRLASQSKLTKVNNHVSSLNFWSNKVTIPHAEVLAIKNAFIQALGDCKVAEETIDRIRTELGLKASGKDDRTFAERSVTPLTRQKIREYLDENAKAINDNFRANNPTSTKPLVRTSTDLYGRLGEAEKTRRAEKREGAAAATAGRRSLDSGSQIALLQDMLVGNTKFRTSAEVDKMLEFAIDQRNLIADELKKDGRDPKTKGEAMVRHELDGGQKVSLFTGRCEADLLKLLDEQIMLLKATGACMGEDEAKFRNDFLSLSAADRQQLLEKLGGGEDDDDDGIDTMCKVRTAAVAMLSERGIEDNDTLGLVNFLPDDEAVQFAKDLVVLSPEIKGDALRSHELITKYAKLRRNEGIDTAAYIPKDVTPEFFNDCIGNAFIRTKALEFLPLDFRKVAVEVQAELKKSFGDGAVPSKITQLPYSSNDIVAACKQSTKEGRRITLEEFRKALTESAAQNVIRNAADAEMVKYVTEAGGKSDLATDLRIALYQKHPEVKEDLAKCKNSADIKNILEKYANDLSGLAKRAVFMDSLDSRFPKLVADAFRREFGMTGGDASVTGVHFERVVRDACKKFKEELIDGKVEIGSDPGEWKDAVRKAAEAVAKERADALRSLDGLEGDAAATDRIRSVWMNAVKIPKVGMEDIKQLAAKIDIKHLSELLSAKEIDVGAVCEEMKNLNLQANENLGNLAQQKGIAIDDETSYPVNSAVLLLAVGKEEGLVAKISAFFERGNVKLENFDYGGGYQDGRMFAFGVRATPEYREMLCGHIGEKGMHPVMARALLQACEDAKVEWLAGFDNAQKVALFAPGSLFGDALRARLEGLPEGTLVTSATVRRLAAEVLQSTDLKSTDPKAMAAVAIAAAQCGVQLDAQKTSRAVALMQKYGTGMLEKNAGLLARYIVNLRLTERSAKYDEAHAKDMAETIGTWRDFKFGDLEMRQLAKAICTQANVMLDGNMKDPGNFTNGNANVYKTMIADAHRGNFIVNGKTIVSQSEDAGAPLVDAVRKAVKSDKALKAVSVLLNQDMIELVTSLQNRLPYSAGPGQEVEAWKLPGAKKLANRNLPGDLYQEMLDLGERAITYELQVSEDGNSATVVTTYANEYSMGTGEQNIPGFGNGSVQVKLKIDLTGDAPKVVEADLAQTLE